MALFVFLLVHAAKPISAERVALRLREDGASQLLELGKPFVEGDQLVTAGSSEGGKERIVPDLRRKSPALGVAPPDRVDVRGLLREGNARIADSASYSRHASAIGTASAPNAFGFVARRRNPCCVSRQNVHPSFNRPSNQ